MSHLPPVGYAPQYSFWPHYLTPPETLLVPARRAGMMLVILGVCLLLGGTCITTAMYQMTDAAIADWLKQSQEMNPQSAAAAAQATPTLVRATYGGLGVLIGLLGVAMVVIGLITRRGSMVAAIFGLLVLALPILGILFMLIAALIVSPLAGAVFLLLMLIPLALMALTAVFLIGAIRNAPQVTQSRQQLMMFHHQQAMQYQAYGQGHEPHGPHPYQMGSPPPPPYPPPPGSPRGPGDPAAPITTPTPEPTPSPEPTGPNPPPPSPPPAGG